jgi:hypothetical protein
MHEYYVNEYIYTTQPTADYNKMLFDLCAKRPGRMDRYNGENVCVINHAKEWVDLRNLNHSYDYKCKWDEYRDTPRGFSKKSVCIEPNFESKWGKLDDSMINKHYSCYADEESVKLGFSFDATIDLFNYSAFSSRSFGKIRYDYSYRWGSLYEQIERDSGLLMTSYRSIENDNIVFQFEATELVLNPTTLTGLVSVPVSKRKIQVICH